MKTITNSSSRKFIFDNNSPLKTNKLTKFLLILFLTLIPLIVIWIICSQFNLLGLNWVVAQNGKYFVSNSQITKILDDLSQQAIVSDQIKLGINFYTWAAKIGNPEYNIILNTIPNFGVGVIFSRWMYLLIFGVLGLNLAIYIPLTIFSKKIYLDIFPMFLATWFGMITLILTGLIPQNQAYTIPVQVIVIVIAFIGTLLLFNFIFNKIMANSKWAESYYQKLIIEDKESEEYYEDYLKHKNKFNKNNKTVIDIPDNQNPDLKKNGEK